MALPGRTTAPQAPSTVHMLERHFALNELAERWGFSYDYLHDKFRDEPGVVSTAKRGSRKRTRATIRIPESVAAKVYSQMVNP